MKRIRIEQNRSTAIDPSALRPCQTANIYDSSRRHRRWRHRALLHWVNGSLLPFANCRGSFVVQILRQPFFLERSTRAELDGQPVDLHTEKLKIVSNCFGFLFSSRLCLIPLQCIYLSSLCFNCFFGLTHTQTRM